MGHQVELAGLSIDTRHFIDGVRLESKETFEDISPIDGSHLANISRGGVREIDLAVQAARKAFPAWANLGPKKRGELLHKLADLVEANLEPLANLETLDNGSLLRSHIRGVMPRVALNLRFLRTGQSTIFITKFGKPVDTQTIFLGIQAVWQR